MNRIYHIISVATIILATIAFWHSYNTKQEIKKVRTELKFLESENEFLIDYILVRSQNSINDTVLYD